MHIICLTPLEEGVYNDRASDTIGAPPEGWAVIPEDFELPATFPRLGSLRAEEKTYTREVEVQKEVTKTRAVPVLGADGTLTTAQEEFTERETVKEEREYTMMTVTEMTEGTPAPEVIPEPTQFDRIEAQVTYTALVTDTLIGEATPATLELDEGDSAAPALAGKIGLWHRQGLWTDEMVRQAEEKGICVEVEE